MLLLQANWTRNRLWIWAESLEEYLHRPSQVSLAELDAVATVAVKVANAQSLRTHAFATPASVLAEAIASDGILPHGAIAQETELELYLPADDAGPWPSDRLSSLAGELEPDHEPQLGRFTVPALGLGDERLLESILLLDRLRASRSLDGGHGLRFWVEVARFVRDLLAGQRFVPGISRDGGDALRAAWLPWIHDDPASQRIGHLLTSMPPIARAVADDNSAQPWPILESALRRLTDLTVRRTLVDEQYVEALDGRDSGTDPHVAWLSGLLAADTRVEVPEGSATEILRQAHAWIGRLDDTRRERPLRLYLELEEPAGVSDWVDDEATKWPLRFGLTGQDHDEMYEAEQIWSPGPNRLGGHEAERLQELLLSELARAGQVYPLVETALSDAHPTSMLLSTVEAHEFLREGRPLLEESGFAVRAPAWWNDARHTLGARLQVDSPELDGPDVEQRSIMGLDSLVRYRWQIAVGDQLLLQDELQSLLANSAPLVRIRGKWIELRPEQLAAAKTLLGEKCDGEMPLVEALHAAYGADGAAPGLSVLGLDATGWVADLLDPGQTSTKLPCQPQPKGFQGTLRPYQLTGLTWLSLLDRFGLGACLADDMGLGKTIQLIALFLLEREQLAEGKHIGPTLLIVPTSLVNNWWRELQRFAPSIRVHVHHGPNRPLGTAFSEAVAQADVVITTYGLASRDKEMLGECKWDRVALDEAQYIKNPPTRQARAIRALKSARRVVLTGTPVENRLGELWSIMDFCNRGYLGSPGEFRRRLEIPVERHRDEEAAERLRGLIRPFVLRRLKTDPSVIDDLPSCVETKEYATLTSEQASLYDTVVKSMMDQVDRADSIQRRGLVLATLVRLKQICNHPVQFLAGGSSAGRETTVDAEPHTLVVRSGKTRRLLTLLEEVVAVGEKALVFTQFRRMGHLLQSVIQHELDVEALFMHGGTSPTKRTKMIDRFQSKSGGAPVFVLSLKTGGVGLNLTAANHVFHFDRWWNPAVENQATDRAFRIGQTRNVHVHKFICVGTLEERIDQMLEQKAELAQNIIGSGEQWLTELTTQQLREMLALRESAMESDA
jgi:SNF2 family DNA or RNA helicase